MMVVLVINLMVVVAAVALALLVVQQIQTLVMGVLVMQCHHSLDLFCHLQFLVLWQLQSDLLVYMLVVVAVVVLVLDLMLLVLAALVAAVMVVTQMSHQVHTIQTQAYMVPAVLML
jgi:hypothetical protein